MRLTEAVVFLAPTLLAAAGGQQVRAADYTVTDLGTLGGVSSFAFGINESGEVVGVSSMSHAPQRAFLYTGGSMKNLGTLGGAQSYVWGFGINSGGQVVGEFDSGPDTGSHGFLYAGGTMIDIGNLGGTGELVSTSASGINADGKVVGESATVNFAGHAFLYSGGTVTDLGTLNGGTSSWARAINDGGQIVGNSDSASHAGHEHAFLYSGGTKTDLGTLGGTMSNASAINSAGQVVGDSYLPGDVTIHAFLYNGGTMNDLGTLGGTGSRANAINSAGQVVGDSYIPSAPFAHGFLYRGGTMTDLNDQVPAGVIVSSAYGINAAGQIAATGTMGGALNEHALLLTPQFLNRLAYALANLPTTVSYTPESQYAHNSSGGPIHITRQTMGVYDVAFDSLPGWGNNGLSSAVAVTAYGSSTIACSVVSYGSSPSSAVATVGCFDVVTKLSADSSFTVMVVGNQSVPTPSAFVFSGGSAPLPPPNPAWSWTTGRNSITITHNRARGSYNVLLDTGSTPKGKGAKLVTGAGGGTRCNNAQGISGGLQVRCYAPAGTASDQRFWVVQVAGGLPGRRIGFAVANLPTSASYTPSASTAFNSSGSAINATRSAVGHYAMNFGGLQKRPGHTEHVQVTSMGTTLSTCNVVDWNNSSDGLKVLVECRNGTGQFMDSQYDVLMIE